MFLANSLRRLNPNVSIFSSVSVPESDCRLDSNVSIFYSVSVPESDFRLDSNVSVFFSAGGTGKHSVGLI